MFGINEEKLFECKLVSIEQHNDSFDTMNEYESSGKEC